MRRTPAEISEYATGSFPPTCDGRRRRGSERSTPEILNFIFLLLEDKFKLFFGGFRHRFYF